MPFTITHTWSITYLEGSCQCGRSLLLSKSHGQYCHFGRSLGKLLFSNACFVILKNPHIKWNNIYADRKQTKGVDLFFTFSLPYYTRIILEHRIKLKLFIFSMQFQSFMGYKLTKVSRFQILFANNKFRSTTCRFYNAAKRSSLQRMVFATRQASPPSYATLQNFSNLIYDFDFISTLCHHNHLTGCCKASAFTVLFMFTVNLVIKKRSIIVFTNTFIYYFLSCLRPNMDLG